ncbi:ATP-binding protein [Streptomyces sp. NPDC051677]|uniref:ATP-binding protein n=1 Tax=Streptomyces sp. NPDC051677 TaxID=3365669 RepID=UPI0037D3BCFD
MPQTSPAPDSWEYSLYIPADPRAVTVCRRTLRLILTLHGLPHLVDTAELLASELVSNAVLHTKGPACLRLRFRDGVLQIGAWDADPEPPDPPRRLEELGDDSESGRGMALVRACSDLWHWQPLSRMGHRGKLVWCELNAA